MSKHQSSDAGPQERPERDGKRLSRRQFLKGAATVAGSAVVTGIVAACGGQVATSAIPTTASAAPTTAAPGAAPTVAAAAKPVAPAVVTPAGKLTLAQGIDPRSLWGNSSTTQQEINVSEQITEKLFEFSTDANEFEPRLATSWRQVDDTTLEVKLRPGVTFTNGEAFDAESAKFSIDEMIKAPSYSSFVGVIAGAEVVDKSTIRIKTKSPTLLHMPALAMGSFQYPPAYFKQVGADGFGQKPIGTGPYKLAEWVKDASVTLEANEKYWAGPPPTKTVVFRNIPEGAAKLAALEAGEIDFIIDVPLDAVERIQRNPDLQLFSRPSNRLFYLVPSVLTDTPLKNAKVRQALWHAVDVNGLIQGLFKGRAKPLAGQVLTPSFFGFDPNRKPTPYDPDRAKQLLAEAGFPNGFEFVFKYPSGRYAQDKEVGQALVSQLQKVGLRPKQEVLESGTFLTQLTSLQLNDMYLGGSLPPPDIHFMYQQFQTGFRYSYYTNAQFDELLKQGAATANREERAGIYKKMLDLCEQDPPYIPLYQPEDYYAGSKKLTGFVPRASQFLDVQTFKLG